MPEEPPDSDALTVRQDTALATPGRIADLPSFLQQTTEGAMILRIGNKNAETLFTPEVSAKIITALMLGRNLLGIDTLRRFLIGEELEDEDLENVVQKTELGVRGLLTAPANRATTDDEEGPGTALQVTIEEESPEERPPAIMKRIQAQPWNNFKKSIAHFRLMLDGLNYDPDGKFLALMEAADWKSAYVDYSYLDFSNSSLKSANFCGAWARYMLLANADLTEANFSHARATFIHCLNATLKSADLSNITADQSTFDSANLSKADMSRGDFTDSYFRNADLQEATVSETNFSKCLFAGAKLGSMQGGSTIMEDLDLYGLDLSRSQLPSVKLSGTVLRKTNLSGVDFSGGSLSGTDMTEANLQGANLSRVDFANVGGLTAEQLAVANFDDAKNLDSELAQAAFAIKAARMG